MGNAFQIRAADPSDAVSIKEIWNHYIRHTAVTFLPSEKTTQDIEALIMAREDAGEAVLVIEDKGICGFATYGPFRNGLGYRFQKEHTILLHPDAKGKGMGRALLEALVRDARGKNIQSLWAGISASNEAAVRFHQNFGFQDGARLNRVGWKFDQWHDLILMRLELRDSAEETH